MATVIVKSRRLAAENSRWQVYLDHIADEHGNEVADYLVVAGHHPRADRITGVAVLPVVNDKLLLVRVHRHPLGQMSWEAPRGFIDEGETPAEAARRELTEETGLQCAPDDLVPLGVYAPEPGTLAACGALFAAMRCVGVPKSTRDELGIGALRLVDRHEMAELVAAGEIVEAGTLILYYRFCERHR
jgi:8-oxo-dGTP pyrophosphatase MutT (NUDIX family)